MSTVIDIVTLAFAATNGLRVLAYVPQILRLADDKSGAASVSACTWLIFLSCNVSTATYCALVLADQWLTLLFVVNATFSAAITCLIFLKRWRRHCRATLFVQPGNLRARSRACSQLGSRSIISTIEGENTMLFDALQYRRNRSNIVPIARWVLATGVAVGTCTVSVKGAAAEQFPSKRITLVLPFGIGSPPDAIGRLVAQSLSTRFGQSVVVVNRPGAGSTVATKEVAAAAADGYTLLQVNSALAYTSLLFPKAGYDPRSSFTPIAGIASWSLIFAINPQVPVSTAQQLVAYAKANPGKVNIGHTLSGPPQVLAHILKRSTRAPFNLVPYRQPPQLIADLVGGRLQGFFGGGANLIALVKEEKLKALAVMTTKRYMAMPDLPSTVEAGLPALAFDPSDWTGIVAPAGTPASVVTTLSAAILESLSSPDVRSGIQLQGGEVMPLPEAKFAAFLANEFSRWPVRFSAAGIAPK
jgi:tripartite-type tricarboxylate transporter receptor subunit TctC